jgi:hypothetical protein
MYSVLILAREHDVDVTVVGRGQPQKEPSREDAAARERLSANFLSRKRTNGQISTAVSCLPYRIGSSGRVLIRARCELRTPRYRTERVLFWYGTAHAHTRRHPGIGWWRSERVSFYRFSFLFLYPTGHPMHRACESDSPQ